MEKEMNWKEVLKGSNDPDFLSMTIPGVTKRVRNLVIKIPEGKRLSLSKVQIIMNFRGVMEVRNIKDLLESMKSEMTIIHQVDSNGRCQELEYVGQALESGMVLLKTINGEMLYNSFATLWLVVHSVEQVTELIARNTILVEIPEEEDVWE